MNFLLILPNFALYNQTYMILLRSLTCMEKSENPLNPEILGKYRRRGTPQSPQVWAKLGESTASPPPLIPARRPPDPGVGEVERGLVHRALICIFTKLLQAVMSL